MAELNDRPVAKDEPKSLLDRLGSWLNWKRFIFMMLLSFFLMSILFPFYWMVSSSFKTRAEIGGREPVYIPSALRTEAYAELFDPNHPSYQNFAQTIFNSVKVAVPTAIIAVPLTHAETSCGSTGDANSAPSLSASVTSTGRPRTGAPSPASCSSSPSLPWSPGSVPPWALTFKITYPF